MATWPATLPQELLSSGFQQKAQSQVIRSDMDAGPPKVRRRFTAKVITIQGSIEINAAQYETLETFFDTTLNGGATSFDWTHPITGDTVSYRFKEPPTYSAVGPVLFRAQLTLEILP